MLIYMSMNHNTDFAAGKGPDPFAAHEIWLDKQDLLTRMHISPRTLQTWRSEGILPFVRIRKKIYYRESDLRALFSNHFLTNKKPNHEHRSKNKTGEVPGKGIPSTS